MGKPTMPTDKDMLNRFYHKLRLDNLLIDKKYSKTYYVCMLTNSDLDEIEKIVDEKIGQKTSLLPTKDEFFGKMDEVMGELKAIREEHTVSSNRLDDHEVRITNLESKSPVKI